MWQIHFDEDNDYGDDGSDDDDHVEYSDDGHDDDDGSDDDVEMLIIFSDEEHADRCPSLSADVLFSGTADGRIVKLIGRRIHTVARLGDPPCGEKPISLFYF